MSKYGSMEDLVDKASWEGSWEYLITGYGLEVEDLPDDAPKGLAEAVAAFKEAYNKLESVVTGAGYEFYI